VLKDFPEESILEVGYTLTDDPGTSVTGLNNILRGRREMIPSNKIVNLLYSNDSGDRKRTIRFDAINLKGSDNGWSVAKYGTADEENNNIVVFRLAEMYLIRAEARAHLNKISGTGSAEEDINILRTRANAPTIAAFSQSQLLGLIEQERIYEFAYEGHRWYDLKRTNRLNPVMNIFSANWKDTYNLWPIPLREIQINPSLANDQNPGY
jgi:starch-binding outer membrane protein, SusD/RagB family